MEVKPFRGYRYNLEKVGDFSNVIAPPYDVIFPEIREKLFQKSDMNIAKVTKADILDDGEVYANAAEIWNKWIEDEVVLQEDKECFYIYKQIFTVNEQKYERFGIIGSLRLQEFGKEVKAHEKTLEGPKADRLNLLRATKTNFGQIFLLYGDEEKKSEEIVAEAMKKDPVLEATDDDGVGHVMYLIDDEEHVTALQKFFEDKPMFIADGHHRYETALNYMNENPDDEEAKYRMVTLVSMHQDGLVVLPTHRMLHSFENFNFESLMNNIANDFYVAKEASFTALKRTMEAGFNSKKHIIGIVTKKEFFSLSLKSFDDYLKQVPELDPVEAKLDVQVLHKLILKKQLRINDEDIAAGRYISFIKGYDAQEKSGLEQLENNESLLMFTLNQTPVEQVADIANTGKRMPQKSTFFYPKIFTGLVMNKLK